MEKTIRLYYSTFVDVALNSEDFSSEEEMIEYARLNASDFLDKEEIYENLALDPMETEIFD